MSDTPELEPGQNLPAPRPPAEPAPGRALLGVPVGPRQRAVAGARRAHRPAVVERALGRLPHDHRRDPVHGPLLVLRGRGPARDHGAAARCRADRPAGHRGRARLQRLRGQLRPLPRGERRRRRRPGPQSPGQAVRPSQRELPPDRAGDGRSLRLRQPELADAGLVEPVHAARAAQLPPDRRADRVPAGDQRRHLHRPRRGARDAPEGPADRQGEDLHRVARPQVPAGPGRDAVSGLLGGRVHDAVRVGRRLGVARAPRLPPARRRRPRPRPRARAAAPGPRRSRSWHRASRSPRPA